MVVRLWVCRRDGTGERRQHRFSDTDVVMMITVVVIWTQTIEVAAIGINDGVANNTGIQIHWMAIVDKIAVVIVVVHIGCGIVVVIVIVAGKYGVERGGWRVESRRRHRGWRRRKRWRRGRWSYKGQRKKKREYKAERKMSLTWSCNKINAVLYGILDSRCPLASVPPQSSTHHYTPPSPSWQQRHWQRLQRRDKDAIRDANANAKDARDFGKRG